MIRLLVVVFDSVMQGLLMLDLIGGDNYASSK